ncbi:hypothetical protein K443DRAFT_7435 [Laccaria amethystina LaAM-08-1]|uniref:DRBM domain-containing protein n=1 Tax=Laccaria amethystina LaAM-08-1 TaxID=1095629 RepID=A0A0C9XGP3_9AGAR|nr:hypothetical protein K443DRAFT_7435 [Laccaria amethystina LaAM-08-1]
MPTKPTPSNIAALMEHNKNRLNNILQRLLREFSLKFTYDQSGPCNDPTWQCNIYLDRNVIAMGGGTTKQHASEGAALSALEHLHGQYHEKYPNVFASDAVKGCWVCSLLDAPSGA